MQTNKINDMKDNYLHVREVLTLHARPDSVLIVCVTVNELTGETEETTLDILSDVFLRDFNNKWLREKAKEEYIKHIKNL